MTDPYEVLGVERDATQDEIKMAYRLLAQQHHPDKGGDKEAFQKVGAAYALLGDIEARKRFDETGQTSRAPVDDLLGDLSQLMLQIVGSTHAVEREDIVLLMRTHLKATIAGYQNQKHGITKAIRKLEAVAKRMKVKEGAQNVLVDVLNAEILKCGEALAHVERHIQRCWKLIDRVDDYVYEGDPGTPTMYSTPFAMPTGW